MDISTDSWKCSISSDNKTASINITPPTEGISYAVSDVVAFLKKNGIVGPVMISEIEDLLSLSKYDQDVVVARGREPIDGISGYYEFFFESGKLKHPAIRPDGSVDYQSMNVVQSVKQGDILAIYHPAIQGSHGVDVKGREIRCKVGKELPELKGNGFELDADNVTYRASMEGRVEYDNFKLYVRELYEVKGDLDLLTGRVDFRGDVIVHGSVRAGTVIRASKSITIEGNVEAAILIAEGDIVLKKGMQGGKKAKIIAGGDIYAYFLEYTEVSARGNIEANIILNCKVSAGKSINVKGKKGCIVGGSYHAVSHIGSTNIGNPAEINTTVSVGLASDLTMRNHLLMTKLEAAKKSVANTKKTIDMYSDARLVDEPKDVRMAKVKQLKRRLSRDERVIEHLEAEIEKIRDTMNLSRDASICVEGSVYPGTIIRIDDKEISITKEVSHMKFTHMADEEIRMSNL